MTRIVPIIDVIILAVPPDKMDTPEDKLGDEMNTLAMITVWAQFAGRARMPININLKKIDWTITGDPDEVERFQPAHECRSCQQANRLAAQALRDDSSLMLALGNIFYDEVWSE